MQNMKIILITKNILNLRDAQAQQSLALVDALANQGFELDIICGLDESDPGQKEIIKKLDSIKNIRLHALPASWTPSGNSIIKKIQRKLIRNINAIIPKKWARNAKSLVKHLIKTKDYKAIVSISLPVESHFAVPSLRYKIPWIACMSDPWPESLLPKPYSDYAIPVMSWLQKLVIQKTINESEANIFTCEEMYEFMLKNYTVPSSTQVFVIPHIAPVFLWRNEIKKSSPIKIVHAGSLSRERVCENFVLALSELDSKNNIEVNFIGFVHPAMADLIRLHKVEHKIKIKPWVSKEDALLECSNADICLLIEAQMNYYPFLPSKLADYSSTGKPIYAITGANSPSSRIIKEYNAGETSDHSKESIKKALASLSMIQEKNSKNLYTYFSRESIASSYKSLIENLHNKSN